MIHHHKHSTGKLNIKHIRSRPPHIQYLLPFLGELWSAPNNIKYFLVLSVTMAGPGDYGPH